MVDFRDTSRVLVINMFGGPCAGKSVNASRLFAVLKDMGIRCEYVTEYAKRKTWEKSLEVLSDQFYVSAKQHHELLMAAQYCDVIVTDSPVITGLSYMSQRDRAAGLSYAVVNYFSNYRNFNVFLDRDPSLYDEVGRNQTVDEAIAVDESILRTLRDYAQAYQHGDSWDTPTGVHARLCGSNSAQVTQQIIARLVDLSLLPGVVGGYSSLAAPLPFGTVPGLPLHMK